MIIDTSFIESYRGKAVDWGFNGLGGVVYKRTYARRQADGTLEEWIDTIARCINGAQEIGAEYTPDEAARLFQYMFDLKGLPGGRLLWQLGTDTVRRYGKSSLTNCWFAPLNTIDGFVFLMDMLLTGGGVGYSVRRADINELPKVKRSVTIKHLNTKDADFIVPDKREGWTELLRRTLTAHLVTGVSFTYSTILVRGAGEIINGFGGTASGPLPLIDGMAKISSVLHAREGKKLRSIDVLDIANIVGGIVVAGNVRRSAQIAIGDADDVLFLRAKNWNSGTVPNWRAMSNNTIYADTADYMTDEFWAGYQGNAEPYGLFNLSLSQTKGRLQDPDIVDNCEGTNPCGEISLAPWESCLLAEVFLPRIDSQEELNDLARLLYKMQKAVAALPSHWKQVNDVVSRNMRIGLGAGGIMQALDKVQWLDTCYTDLRAFDKVWSKARGWNESIKLTTIKPSGTLSLLAGVTPGIHPAYARYYIRRVRMSTNDPLVEQCRAMGYAVEFVRGFDNLPDYSTSIVSFPCDAGDHTLVAAQVTAIEMLEHVATLQAVWSDNAVSATVYYRKEELSTIQGWLKDNYESRIKSISFLLHNDHGFQQAPYEEIDAETYTREMSRLREGSFTDTGGAMLDMEDCIGGICPIR